MKQINKFLAFDTEMFKFNLKKFKHSSVKDQFYFKILISRDKLLEVRITGFHKGNESIVFSNYSQDSIYDYLNLQVYQSLQDQSPLYTLTFQRDPFKEIAKTKRGYEVLLQERDGTESFGYMDSLTKKVDNDTSIMGRICKELNEFYPDNNLYMKYLEKFLDRNF